MNLNSNTELLKQQLQVFSKTDLVQLYNNLLKVINILEPMIRENDIQTKKEAIDPSDLIEKLISSEYYPCSLPNNL